MAATARSRTVRTITTASGATAAWAGLEYALVLAAAQQWRVVTAPGPAGLEPALTLVASAIAVVLCTWLGLSTLAAVLTHLPGRVGRLADHVAEAWAPPVSRRLAAVLVGATVTGALAPGTALGEAPPILPAVAAAQAPAMAAQAPAGAAVVAMRAPVQGPGFTPTDQAPGFRRTGAELPSPGFRVTDQARGSTTGPSQPSPGFAATEVPGWVPTRPLQRPQPSAALVAPGHAHREVAEVVVHRGDTLWGIVARHLGPHASDAEVARAWPRWYTANRHVIGDDPDLIKPGQVLRAPGTHRAEATR